MTEFNFIPRPRKRNSNEPLTYDITEGGTETTAGTLRKQKNKWRLNWRGVSAEFDTKHQMRRHLSVLGHGVVGL